jgi:hypothetical protein
MSKLYTVHDNFEYISASCWTICGVQARTVLSVVMRSSLIAREQEQCSWTSRGLVEKTQPGLTTKGGSHIVNENNRVVATAGHVFNSVARPAVELFLLAEGVSYLLS